VEEEQIREGALPATTDRLEEEAMRYMMFVKHPKDYAGEQAPAALYVAMGEFIEDMTKKGIFIDGAGLEPLSKGGARIRLAKGKVTVTDGPFGEAKEVVGGYAVCECKSHEQALELATKFMELHRIHWPEFEGESELRPFQGGEG
jgi:hypothetical protein